MHYIILALYYAYIEGKIYLRQTTLFLLYIMNRDKLTDRMHI